MIGDIELKLHKLITDPNFLELKRLQDQSNLFAILAVSHTEMWHSAFVKWLIDPNSSLGLRDFPLKRFIFVALYLGEFDENSEKPSISIGDLEGYNFESMEFTTEYSNHKLIGPNGGKARIDIIGLSENVTNYNAPESRPFRIIIENKIKAKESKDQTNIYYQHMLATKGNFESEPFDFLIFLTPDESQSPGCNQFIKITYQMICDHVIKPCLNHPGISRENTYLLEQYLANLARPLKEGKVMANPYTELCEKIYAAHQEVLDAIFVAVKKEAPNSTTSLS